MGEKTNFSSIGEKMKNTVLPTSKMVEFFLMGDYVPFQDKINHPGIASLNFRADDICQQD